jgi:CheY-like chemotaxis protein
MPGQGSTFTLYLPAVYTPPRGGRKAPASDPASTGPRNLAEFSPTGAGGVPAPPALRELPVESPDAADLSVNELDDDRDQIQQGDRVILIIENDVNFARFLLEVCREKGFKGLVTTRGAAGLALAREYNPDVLTLDIHLPDIDGWRVLDRLKNDIGSRHIPVCVISTDESRERVLAAGALAFVAKPIQNRDVLDELLKQVDAHVRRTVKHLLVVEPNGERRQAVLEALDLEDIEVSAVADVDAAEKLLRSGAVDCAVFSPEAADHAEKRWQHEAGNGEAVVRRIPLIVYGQATDEASGDGELPWRRLANRFLIRRVHAADRLLDWTVFFLHRRVAKLPDEQRQLLLELHQSDRLLAGKKVLVVDDDMRNIFALSTVLEDHEMIVTSADTGRGAIHALHNEPDIDIVLMDIMMPEMDGMETIREIRKAPRLKNVPIVAVTAKAMKGDREKCIEAGAWDYLSKPVDTEQMLAVLRAWLHR